MYISNVKYKVFLLPIKSDKGPMVTPPMSSHRGGHMVNRAVRYLGTETQPVAMYDIEYM
jgi:hypothetical protein